MAVKLRLRKSGKRINKNYHFRLVAIDSRKSRDGRFIEELGYYNPSKTSDQFKLNIERIDYWLKCGAQPSDTVASLIKKAKKGKNK